MLRLTALLLVLVLLASAVSGLNNEREYMV
jgi:hypothetical protein